MPYEGGGIDKRGGYLISVVERRRREKGKWGHAGTCKAHRVQIRMSEGIGCSKKKRGTTPIKANN